MSKKQKVSPPPLKSVTHIRTQYGGSPQTKAGFDQECLVQALHTSVSWSPLQASFYIIAMM
jgi:hypothetical protein